MDTSTNSQTIQFSVPIEDISDLLCSALEGGSNSWYWIDGYINPTEWQFNSHDIPTKHYSQDYPLNPGGTLLMRDMLDDDHGVMRLDAEGIERGLKVMAEKYSWHYQDVLNENADADTGDVFLQCCLFGEIIYG